MFFIALVRILLNNIIARW